MITIPRFGQLADSNLQKSVAVVTGTIIFDSVITITAPISEESGSSPYLR